MKKTLTCTLRSAILFFCLTLYPAYFNAQTSDIFYVESPVRFQGLTTDNSQSKVIAADANGNLFFKDVSSLSNPGVWLNKGMSGKGGNEQVTNRPKSFVIMPSVTAAMKFKANYILGHGGNYARWYSTNPSNQEIYRKQLQLVKSKIVNDF